MIEPIRPEEIAFKKLIQIPDIVMESFNYFIAKGMSEGRSVVWQEDIVSRITGSGHSRHEIFANNWLDVEDIYRNAGWEVGYEKPGYNETGKAFFSFSRKDRTLA